ncbi:hypothetical protein SteCoe_16388 [Stentor coeruleus]|uniref:Non-haem dioxygenase N-terminal domain-containing protein n=1 Tax=Stentor coeruleus TaxID=5963 RepID=A0A1R2C181_9CILI|nr:hypothetical protein SteCoe_16388 [Stentor coeruleus]
MLSTLTRLCSHLQPINLKFSDLNISKNLSNELFEAFSKDGLGLLTISGIPKYKSKCSKLLSMSYELCQLSISEKSKIENPESGYKIGWKDNCHDYPYGTFTANPLDDYREESFYHNLWPNSKMPLLRPAFRDLSTSILNTSFLIAQHIDKYLENIYPYSTICRFKDLLCSSKDHIGALNSCGTCVDEIEGWKSFYSVFVAYSCPIYVDKSSLTMRWNEEFNYETGIYVQDKDHNPVHIKLDNDMLLIQVGKAAQIISGGIFDSKPISFSHNAQFSGIKKSDFRVFLNPNSNSQIYCPDETNTYNTSKIDHQLKHFFKSGMPFSNLKSLF